MSSTLERSLETAAAELDQEDVRTALEDALTADKQTLSNITPDVGIPYGTLSAWRGRTYQGNNARVAAAVQAWLIKREARANARATLPAEPGFVMTPTASQIWELCEFAMTTPAIGVVIGGAGVGKTTALRAYRERLPQTVWIATLQPCHNTLAAVMRELAFAVNATAPHRSYDVVRSVIHRIRGTRGLLIIDEGQHATSEALDQLRSIFDASETGLVLTGNKELSAHMGADRRRDQLAQIYSRIGMRFTRERPQKRDINTLLDAWRVTGSEERAELQGIAAQPGGARVLTMVLRIAIGIGGAEGATLANIRAAWSQLNGSANAAGA